MDHKDYYKIIVVNREASQDEIKRAYRKLVRKYHPDVSKERDAELRFKEISEAYEALKHPDKRAAYDKLNIPHINTSTTDWSNNFEFNHGEFSPRHASKCNDFFETLFIRDIGSTKSSPNQVTFNPNGENHHAKIAIDLEDACRGATLNFTLETPEFDNCGHIITKLRTINVKIPKGIKQGQQIRLAGQGGIGIDNAPAGDLFLEVEFKPHSMYRIVGHDIYLDFPLTPWEAALGATIKIPTPYGYVALKIAKDTISGKKLRLKGCGIKGNPPGDLYIIPTITLPPANSEIAIHLYRQMEKEMPYDPRSQLGF